MFDAEAYVGETVDCDTVLEVFQAVYEVGGLKTIVKAYDPMNRLAGVAVGDGQQTSLWARTSLMSLRRDQDPRKVLLGPSRVEETCATLVECHKEGLSWEEAAERLHTLM